MEIFISEFIYFSTLIFSATVTCTTAVFFLVTGYREKQCFRLAYGTAATLLTGALLSSLFQQAWPSLGSLTAQLEAAGVFLLFVSSFINPEISCIAQPPKDRHCPKLKPHSLSAKAITAVSVIIFFIFTAVALRSPNLIPIEPAFAFQIVALIVAFILNVTMVTHFIKNRHHGICFKRAMYLGIGYLLIFFRESLLTFIYQPTTSSVLIEQSRTPYGSAWIIMSIVTLLAFAVLGRWSWDFIRQTDIIKRFVMLLLTSITFAAAGSLIFTVLMFSQMERDQIGLVTHSSESELIFTQSQLDMSMYIARLAGTNPVILQAIKEGDYTNASLFADRYVEQTKISHLRLYTKYGEVFVSATDPREEHQLSTTDPLLGYVLVNKTQAQSFDTVKGVLVPQIIARALYPLIQEGELLGAVETVYTFDNAHADYIKSATHLDITFFTGAQRSATTLVSSDGVSRWIGSFTTEPDVVSQALEHGEPVALKTSMLDETYYASYQPIRHLDGSVIGMFSVAHSANEVLEQTRLRLLHGFYIATVGSFILALIVLFATTMRRRWIAESR
ncbi:MAG: hypothetical protein UY72_C0010G0002 [Candidatus Uhrbacteria bacterium GW2011_GWD2_52_7]|uniref:Single cache domain-containing protein n=1 Tax=Candidatus Uhrbacteria bacterium GW2011_GWD2_52_7 TaxID=1618989 RepID=A0A0G1ZQK6_9BACT|nr:MAG: hypothetical protein UY72_C0010G0002 [Candidatus Uhrbacteria bacterium GW2011_GWD2_52_7]